MRTLLQTLQDHDPGYLRVVAELWGIELAPGADAGSLAEAVLAALDQLALPPPAQQALEALQRAGGRLSWEQLNRRFGPLREMGAGRRDRLKPWREPVSALEMLWYRGLLGRAFADSPLGPQEFGFIPTDLHQRLPAPSAGPGAPLGKPAPAPRRERGATSHAVDDATTLLAYLRRSPTPVKEDEKQLDLARKQLQPFLLQPQALELLLTLVSGLPGSPQQLKRFLTDDRGRSLAWLQRAWRESTAWNDLAGMGGLRIAEPDWPNDPAAGRQAALELLRQIPAGEWWSLPSFVEAVHQRVPEFLRPAGGFDSWYLQSADDGRFLTGFGHWIEVEGAYLRYLFAGPLHWLGAVDLSDDTQAVRLSATAGPLLGQAGSIEIDEPPGRIAVRADGEIRVARTADRSLRYQIARFTHWERADSGGYRYRLSAASLELAADRGLTAAHALSLLEQAAGDRLPVGVKRALERWDSNGAEAKLGRELVLQVNDPGLLEQLLEQRSTRRWIQKRLGPERATVREVDWERLAAAALALGLLIKEPD